MFVIVKPTLACNARCTYCAAQHFTPQTPRMSNETLHSLFQALPVWGKATRQMEQDTVHLLWHGGEPLVMGPRFFEQVLEETRKLHHTNPRLEIRHHLQTNLLLWNSDFEEVFKELLRDRSLSSSVDPFDRSRRRLANGSDYFSLWLAQAQRAQEAGFRIGAVCVVDSEVAANPRRAYTFFKNLTARPSVRFNPLYPARRGETAEGGISSAQWGQFLVELWHIWLEDHRELAVQPLANWYASQKNGVVRGSCDMSGRCSTGFLGVDPDGNVSQCGRAADAEVLHYGTLTNPAGCLDSANRQANHQRMHTLREGHCADCSWWAYCHGGCPLQSWLASGELDGPTFWCEGRKAFFEECLRTPENVEERGA